MVGRLAGKNVLIVEERSLLKSDARNALEEAGALVLGPVASADAALSFIAADQVDAAILDIELHAEDAFAVADELLRRNTPFVFASNSERDQVPGRFEGFYLVAKPVELRRIIEALLGPPH
jgi:DNA-binding response OmpR family regulator